jgi:hypothetical protein
MLLLADLVVVLHLAFVVFVVAGGLLVLRWPHVIWIHVPAAVWGAVTEALALGCPLTPLENWLRAAGGQPGYEGGFVARYVVPILYPGELTRTHQAVLAVAVVVVNAVIYTVVWRRRRRRA